MMCSFYFSSIDYPSTDGTYGNPILQKIVTLRNTGNMKAIIYDISFGLASAYGSTVLGKIFYDLNFFLLYFLLLR